MLQYTVPQFIEKETKVVGPFSLKQSLYLLVPGTISFVLFYLVSFTAFLVISLIICSIGASFALLKIKNTPFPIFLRNFLLFLTKPKIYFWQKQKSNIQKPKKIIVKEEETKPKFKLTKKNSKLKDALTKLEIK